ncbi:MAG: excinuclease ABC subunit B [Candidatus Woykebacteria bacterium RBG_13_40_15]|uniref:UvrABC system protein B n=1 Tax=Candidatus Woykebacteria bacterium RBG_13_40_15 TaxID=1802593 RepID=A0A1G1W735_9BACT|nr:MAG: excinuclease ABC subunit B [Candidatus Woykebacteria bacterium RBG_13_40_15]
MDKFDLKAPWPPTGDQPEAIKKLVEGLEKNYRFQTLLGATGTGKTFTMANIVAQVNRPTLVIAHNKTLAAQLASEFREFFPNNAVEYFVSYYDYYQPESYVPQIDLYIEKDSDINDEIDRLRLAATKALLTRRDVLIVASVSCIYNIGSPDAYRQSILTLFNVQPITLNQVKEQLIRLQYERNDLDLKRAAFRVRGDTLEIYPAYEEFVVRVSFFGEKVEKITKLDSTSLEKIEDLEEISIFPARHYNVPINLPYDPLEEIKREFKTVSSRLKKENKLVELQRLTSRVKYDLEMIKEVGSVKGIENYSRYFDGRKPGEPPFTLLDYFPKDFATFIDESHMSVPQIKGMWYGERSRKNTLIDFGFRLPSAIDNRPLTFEEFLKKTGQIIFTSATPDEYELTLSKNNGIAEQIIRPTGIVDPEIEVKKTEGQIPDLISEIQKRVGKGQRVLVTTLTKRMAEDLTDYLAERDMKVMYIHYMVDTLERVDILRDLRTGKYDVLVGINLLREGLDLPEVSLIAILDADKEGFLRSKTSLIQTIGRASRHVEGRVIMYADTITKSIKGAIDETNRRRKIQVEYNRKHRISPSTIEKAIHDIGERVRQLQPEVESTAELDLTKVPKEEVKKLIRDLTAEMLSAAKIMDFEKAALLRDQIQEIKNQELEIPKTISVKEARKFKI